MRSPNNIAVDARQTELLPENAIDRAIDTKTAMLESRLVVNLRMRRDERRRREVESPRDLGGVHADPGALTDERTAVDDDVERH